MDVGDWLFVTSLIVLTVIIGLAWYLVTLGLGQHALDYPAENKGTILHVGQISCIV